MRLFEYGVCISSLSYLLCIYCLTDHRSGSFCALSDDINKHRVSVCVFHLHNAPHTLPIV